MKSTVAVSSRVCSQSKIIALRSYLDRGLPRSRSISFVDSIPMSRGPEDADVAVVVAEVVVGAFDGCAMLFSDAGDAFFPAMRDV